VTSAEGGAPDAELVERFNRRLAELFSTARNFMPTLAVRNLPELGPEDGLPLARHTLATPAASPSFEELWAANCLEFTVEWLVTQPQYKRLFTATEIDIARRRVGLEPLYRDPAEYVAEDEERLRRRLLDLCDRSTRELRYDPRHFRALVEARGGAEAVRAVLAEPALLGALGELVEAGRHDLSVEAAALDPVFERLFTAEELATARARLGR